jgi:hypothetical protein
MIHTLLRPSTDFVQPQLALTYSFTLRESEAFAEL